MTADLKEESLLLLQTGSRNLCGGTNLCFAPILGPVVDRPSVRLAYIGTHTEDEIHPRQTAVQRMSHFLISIRSFDHDISCCPFVVSTVLSVLLPRSFHLKWCSILIGLIVFVIFLLMNRRCPSTSAGKEIEASRTIHPRAPFDAAARPD